MAPKGSGLSVKHRIRRLHPLRPPIQRDLARMEQADHAALVAYQERRLRLLVRWAAARSPFYRETFRQNGIDPRDIRTLADLTQLPLVRRSHLIERREDFRAYPAGLMWTASSSGTSGAPVTVHRTQGSSVYELSALERQWRWFGLDADSRRIVLRGSDFMADQTDDPVRAMPGNRQLMVSSFYLTPEYLPRILDAIADFGPEAIEGWPSSIALLAGLLDERGETLPLRGIITSSEVMPGPTRALMRRVFGGPIIDHYGQTERAVMTGTCEHGTHHVFDDYGIVELLPVDRTHDTPAGDRGADDRRQIVATPLHNWGFPLLRYATGDEVGPAGSQPCPCGRAFTRIGEIAGRVEDSFTAADGRRLPLPSTVIDDLRGLRAAQIVQRAPGDFEVRVVPGADFDASASTAEIHGNVDRMFGPGQLVTIRQLDSLPREPNGKVRSAFVLDEQAT